MIDIAAHIEWNEQEIQSHDDIAIYGLIDPFDRLMRYVGQTHDPVQRYRGHLRIAGSACNPEKARWILMLLQQGVYPVMEIFGILSRAEAYDIEMLVIGDHLHYGLLKNQRVPTDAEYRALKEKYHWYSSKESGAGR